MIEKVKIGCLEYDVIETDEPLIINNKCDYNGIINYENLTIKIKQGMAEKAKNLVLWHEIMHAIEKQYNLDLGDNSENIIESFANGVYQVLQSNKSLPGSDSA
jgi:Zn-dependent peptidase ImmA (M78 family)